MTWETSEQTNIGIDARFLDNRLSFTMDWYNKQTKDLLVEVGTNAASGFSSQYQNAGTVKNTGLELSMGWRDQIGKEFKYGVNVNMAYNKNEVTEVNNANHFIEGGNDLLAQSTGRFVRMEEGHPIGYFYGYKTDGVIQNQNDLQAYLDQNCKGNAANSKQGASIKPGDLKFVDVDGNGVINDDDKTDLGNPHPDVTMGLTLSAEYKGFDFSVTTYGAFGAQVLVLGESSQTDSMKTIRQKFTITGTEKEPQTDIRCLRREIVDRISRPFQIFILMMPTMFAFKI